ncbi:hypothetical protein GCM10007916_30910 [Psychromonas marina]|uniref:Uncharacterized protein n=1 Tax=Psychromonas marina TaxID=88364 RepID=A0ABQ6E3R8_9GAMM|nr:hypothetical protein [Psychromonas marina]GLS92021.1 hypothetical protein GCM10007916_30910 [Psychromonas marina]
MKLHPLVLALGITSLAGCNSDSEPVAPDTVIPEPVTTYSVRAIDGYLRNAMVWLDIDGDFQLDEGEPQAVSSEGGNAVLDISNTPNPENYSVVVKAIVGETVDEDTITETNPEGVATTTPFLLSAPAGQTVVTPLSTLVNIKMLNGLSQQQATKEVAADLGIAEDALLGDYIEDKQGDIASKANAIVELDLLPESEAEMQEMSEDDSALDEQLEEDLEVIKSLTDEQRIVVDDEGKRIIATNIDSDDDGIIDEKDVFPEDATEWLDTDKDSIGNNSDAFPNDPTETMDSDKDGTGDNSDIFPDDATEWLDTDNDNVGDNSDAYIDDPEKSVLDVSTTINYTAPFVHAVYKQVTLLEVTEENIVITYNNGQVHTDKTVTYITPEGIQYGSVTSADLLNTDGTFTRTSEWAYDFDLDGDAKFLGNGLEIGSRTASGEHFLIYGDEALASLEGGSNGEGRIFDDVDFSSRTHPDDLSNIDFIANVSVSWQEEAGNKIITSDFVQYVKEEFDHTNLAAASVEYKESKREEVNDSGVTTYREQLEDWDGNDSINQVTQLTVAGSNQYSFIHQRPVWANPTDGIDEEYADFNFAGGKWDSLSPYWYETNDTLDDQGIRTYSGQRYVMDSTSMSKFVDSENENGLLFNEYVAINKTINDSERTEFVTWSHYPLADYEFTTDTLDIGQAYKVYQKQSNGIWVGFSFPEWGSQSVTDLATKIEDARSGDLALSEIDDIVVPGLSVYNQPITTSSFIYDETGEARTWYLVSNNLLITDGQYTMSNVTLTDNGIKEGWIVVNAADQLVFLEPMVDEPWQWFDAYNRHWAGITSLNTENFMWGSNLGEFYLDESQATARLTSLLPLMDCNIDNSPWDDINDQPASFNSLAEYNDAVTACGGASETIFTAALLTGENLDQTSEWILGETINNEFIEDERIRFYPGGTGAFIDAEDGQFSFNWSISDGQLHLEITAALYAGSQNIDTIVDFNGGDYYSVKSFWRDVSGEDYTAPAEGQGEITSQLMKFDHYSNEDAPAAFTEEWLSGRTLYTVWFGDGDLVNDQGQAIDAEGNLIPDGEDTIDVNNVAVVQAVTYASDGTVSAVGLRNSTSSPEGVFYHYGVDANGILRIEEEQNEATEGNFICDNTHPDYLKTHFILSDQNGVEQFDNVDLFFYDMQAALDYADGLISDISRCN